MNIILKKDFTPDYTNVVQAAKNIEVSRIPLYEHIICHEIMEKITNDPFGSLSGGDRKDRLEFFRRYCNFWKLMGYDTVSYECCLGDAFPGGGALGGHISGVIQDRDDFDKYPWDEVEGIYFRQASENFALLRQAMPAGMKAIGGVGNGVFECVQNLTGYMDLCYIRSDDPELYEDLFRKLGEILASVWQRFLREYSDIFCVLRFGDDLGFKSTTLLPPDDIRKHIIPQYKRIIDMVHREGKPFLLHSCGCIFNVMEDLIAAGIDAKHSNEDQIAYFPECVHNYGDRIGNFGGIDTDAVCRLDKTAMREYITDVVGQCRGHGGFAFSTGNSIPNYVPAEGYLTMVETVRELRGE